jgi:hypothetical protein
VDTTTLLMTGRRPLFTATADARDYSVFTVSIPQRPYACRIGVLWDADRDARAQLALVAIRFRNPSIFPAIKALAEHKTSLRCWIDAAVRDPAEVRAHIQRTIDAALSPHDQWRVEAPQLVQCSADGVLLRDKLPADSPLRIIPANYPLGLVHP